VGTRIPPDPVYVVHVSSQSWQRPGEFQHLGGGNALSIWPSQNIDYSITGEKQIAKHAHMYIHMTQWDDGIDRQKL
jgi:hypothetical protein